MHLDPEHACEAAARFREFYVVTNAQSADADDAEAACEAFYEGTGFTEEFRNHLYSHAVDMAERDLDTFAFGMGALLALLAVQEAYELTDAEGELDDDAIREGLGL